MITNAVTLEQGVTVTQLKGQIYLVAADGSRKLLAEGDVLPKGAVIMSPDGASFMGGGQSFNVQPASEQSEPAEEGDAPQLAQNGAAGTPDDINALQQAILGGADPTQAFEASAAGGAPAAGGGGIGGVAGSSGNGGFVTIDRTGDATIAEATFDTTYNANGEPPLGVAGEDEVFDLTPPTISVVAPDNTKDSTPTLTGTTDAPVGSTVTLLVTDANGNQQTLTAIVTPAGTFTVDVVTPLAEGSYTVTATVTDPAGNTGSATDSGSVDVTAPVITVDAPDNTQDTTPTITGTTNAVPGSTVTLVVTDANGTQQTLTATVQPGGSYSVDVTTPLAEGSYQVTASVTDPADNIGTATDDGSVDSKAPDLAIKLDADITPDDVINAAEAGQQIPVSGTVSGEFKAGDTVTLTVNDTAYTGKVDAAGRFTILVAGSDLAADKDQTIDASVTSTDAAGNSSTATDRESYEVDTDLPSIDLAAIGDGNLSVDEAKAVELKGETRHVEDGQKVTLTLLDVNGKPLTDVNGKVVTFEATVTDGKFSTTVNLAASGLADGQFTVKADVTDKAGNPASDKEEAILDSDSADLPSIDLAAIGDGNLSVDEAKAVEL
uniref:retention module-containing protein n=1 Tax=Aeromonas allosaccharophila TaxID=656 RepID=UPI003D231136